MIDIHSHLLPSIDDGSRSFDESIRLIKSAIDVGVTDIIITPHYYPRKEFVANNETKISLFNELTNLTSDLDINLHLGNEIFLKNNIKELINENEVLTIAGTKFLLVELSRHEISNNVLNYIHELQLDGYKIIMAHPERYPFFQKDINSMIPFLEQGVIFQGNIGSFFGIYGKKATDSLKKMINCNMISIIATDSHKDDYTFYKYVPKMKKFLSDEQIEKFTVVNPKKIFIDGEIINTEYKEFKRGFFKNKGK